MHLGNFNLYLTTHHASEKIGIIGSRFFLKNCDKFSPFCRGEKMA
jgi:hypothetical protein